MALLTREQVDTFEREGYLVVRGCVSSGQCAALLDEIWGILRPLGVRRDSPSTWEAWPERGAGSGFLDAFPVYHLHGAWANRQDPRLYECHVDLLGVRELVVSIDRVNFKRPTRVVGEERAAWLGRGFLHHDVNLWHAPEERAVQGLVALTDAGEDEGGFQCVPGFHREAREWARAHPERAVPSEQTLVDFKPPAPDRVRAVPLATGDLLLWDVLLPHGSSPNRSGRFRGCQYVRMFPADDLDASMREDRLRSYATGEPPRRFSTGSVVRSSGAATEVRYEPPPLTSLGRKLLGCDSW